MPKGFFASLFDISFKNFVTAKLISVIYVLALIGIGIMTIVFTASILGNEDTSKALLLLVPFFFFFAILYVRVILEVIVVQFRIAENTSIMAGHGGAGLSGPSSPTGAPRPPQAPSAPEAPQVPPAQGGGALQSFTQPPPAGPGQPPQGPQSPGR